MFMCSYEFVIYIFFNLLVSNFFFKFTKIIWGFLKEKLLKFLYVFLDFI